MTSRMMRLGMLASAALAVVAGLFLISVWVAGSGAGGSMPTDARDGEQPQLQFRCGYAAKRAGVEDPECAELRRPAPPAAVSAATAELIAHSDTAEHSEADE